MKLRKAKRFNTVESYAACICLYASCSCSCGSCTCNPEHSQSSRDVGMSDSRDQSAYASRFDYANISV